ncbi:MAG: maleylpyruvate isomerase family mycothiol-dependent enzyme [Actinobacteria bacterium]|nr:maleylpyruvate isomerase family mycothiol-dependent enzyme [Actinomycetota bacterium]
MNFAREHAVVITLGHGRSRRAIAELETEHAELESLLRSLSPDQWRAQTPAELWDVRAQVAHLADTNEICIDTIGGGPRPLNETALSYGSPEAFTASGVDRARTMSDDELLDWWVTSAAGTREAINDTDPRARIPWGLGMSPPMMATARLMEHWAHGCDIRAAIGAPFSKTVRLKSVSFLTLRAVPYALGYAKVDPPPGTLRAELTHDGEVWPFGPDDADNLITGDAFEFCRLGIRRITRAQCETLKAHGQLAEAALDNLRAFL